MDFWTLGIPTPVALAAVAVIGYLFGRRRRTETPNRAIARRELKRAKAVIRELETIAREVRRSLATHHTSVLHFREQVSELSAQKDTAVWLRLSEEAERMLKPTLRLSTQIAHAYDEIRQQTNLLMTFTEVRTDPLTGLSNRRALDESLLTMFALLTRYGNQFSLAIFDLDHFKRVNDEQGHLHGDYMLQQVARLMDLCVRETDIVSRYGGEEFVVVMPETDLAGASVICDRIRREVQDKLTLTVSGGIAAALDGDTSRTLLARADAALYGAKSAGRNAVYQNMGQQILPILKIEQQADEEDPADESLAVTAPTLASDCALAATM
jgi:diguanylate cyclase